MLEGGKPPPPGSFGDGLFRLGEQIVAMAVVFGHETANGASWLGFSVGYARILRGRAPSL